ncbi:semialdehyde dehydrogenase, partial [Klebsiella pneumoniae]
MRIVLFGASGMVGQGALLACLKASDVTESIVVGRQSLRGYDDPRIKVVVVPDLKTFDASDAVFANVDACFFC